MPLYDYVCDHCHKKFEVVVGKLALKKKKKCPSCKKKYLRRLPNNVGAIKVW